MPNRFYRRDYDEFNNIRLMPSLTPVVYALSLLIHSHFSFALLIMVMFTWDTYVRLVLLLVLPSTLVAYLGWSMFMVLMVLLVSVWWAATQLSWATLF